MREEKEMNILQTQLIIKYEKYTHRAQSLYETVLKRKEQLETDFSVLQNRMSNIESSLKRCVGADRNRELNTERLRLRGRGFVISMHLCKEYALSATTNADNTRNIYERAF